MKINILLLLVGVMLFSLIPYVGHTEEKIIWFRSDFPPMSIPSGPYADKGSCDRVTALLIDKLNGYNHTVIISNYKRVLLEIKKQHKSGSAALLKTPEREKFVEFSIPYRVVLPNGIELLPQ